MLIDEKPVIFSSGRVCSPVFVKSANESGLFSGRALLFQQSPPDFGKRFIAFVLYLGNILSNFH